MIHRCGVFRRQKSAAARGASRRNRPFNHGFSLPVPPRKSFVPRFLPPRTMINRFTCTTAARRQTLGCGGAWRAEKTPLAYKGVPSEGAHPVPAPTYPRPSRNTPFAHAERVAGLSARILHLKRLNGALWCVFYAFFGAHVPSLRASVVSAPVFLAPHARPPSLPFRPHRSVTIADT